jgi:tartrate dehydrogenase/decarboxylase/D-malate dehydrogenase
MDPKTKKRKAMYEPVHGSAPDIAGKGVANPIGQVWAGAMMLDHLGHPQAARAIVSAIESVLADPATRTRDLGGSASTVECGRAIATAVKQSPDGVGGNP